MNDYQIDNIQEMEVIFTKVEDTLEKLFESFNNWERLQADYKKLLDYYHSKQWLKDIEYSNSKDFPKKISCGVLSQDGIYNLIDKQEQLINLFIERTNTSMTIKSR